MDTQKYFELNYMDEEYAAQCALHGEVWHLLHAINKTHSAEMRVSFPFWKDPVKTEQGAILKKGSFGPVMRVFAEEAKLRAIYEEVAKHRLITSGLVGLSILKEVPANAGVEYFVRSRASDRITDAYAQSTDRQQAKKAQKGNFSAGFQFDRNLAGASQAKTRANFIAFRSSKNGFRYSLSVERWASLTRPKELNSFGLGGAVPSF